MVSATGFEPMACKLGICCSIHLSYADIETEFYQKLASLMDKFSIKEIIDILILIKEGEKMKKVILALMIISGLSSVATAATYNKVINKQCKYNLSITDTYNTIANGYILGLVVGIQAAIPEAKRSKIVKQSIGYISDKACIVAINNKSKLGFEQKYKDALVSIMTK